MTTEAENMALLAAEGAGMLRVEFLDPLRVLDLLADEADGDVAACNRVKALNALFDEMLRRRRASQPPLSCVGCDAGVEFPPTRLGLVIPDVASPRVLSAICFCSRCEVDPAAAVQRWARLYMPSARTVSGIHHAAGHA